MEYAIPHGLDFGGDEILVNGTLEALLQRNGLIVVVVLAAGVGEAQARSLRPLEFGGILEVLFHERPVRQVFEIAAAERLRCSHDSIAHGEQDVTRRLAAHHGIVDEVGRADLLVPLQGRGAIDDDAMVF